MFGDRTRSQMLVFLMISSTMVALLGPTYPVMAANETASGTITGTEVWSGQHQLTGDVTVSPGAKLIIEPGSIISFPNGTSLDIRGNLCAGLQSCGASSNADQFSFILLDWQEPENESATGECYGLGSGSNKVEFRNGTTASAPVEFTIFTAAQGTYVGINRRFEDGIFADCDGSAEVTVVFK